MVELGQAIFGNKWETCDFDYSDDVYTLMQWAMKKADENWEVEYENDTFEIRPYYWGYCTCGYENATWEWEEGHNHADNCYQTEYREVTRNLGFMDPRAKKKVRELCDKYGFPYPNGSAIHCSCDYQTEWSKWVEANGHDETCPVVLPNFKHYSSGLEVYWYKHIGRSTTANKIVTFEEWQDIYDECRQSLR